ncbi:flavodoxin family protein [Mesorhizobium sp. INR15]|uniref:flavodoxin family protein n=1 Tax=Mesorhizobium sp. INR15 TaxID=2654248 RepID=UPI0018967F5B|nr:NAD(P)H-dependent oxidoreductase [Mesorhizobium sp. INR15]QPC95945.1 flavodoxin family protein [Mesorhizobium sp. INR15]
MADQNQKSFSDLKALFINTTLTRSPKNSHTELIMRKSMAVMEANGVNVEYLRAVDHSIASGIQPDMRKEGWETDEWPEHIWPKVNAADILVIGTPIWLGEESSVCRVIIERLYAHSGQTNENGQYVYYGKAGGCIVTGNEDGIKHCSMTVLYALQHIGYTIPPQADCGWIGEAGPGSSYGDGGAGLDNEFTKRNTAFMSWNLMHMARMLKDAGGIPAHGNQPEAWKAGDHFDHPDG